MKKYNVVIVGGGSHRNPDLMAMLASKRCISFKASSSI